MLKRILSLILCVVMVISMVPVGTFARETQTEPAQLLAEPTEVPEETTVPAETVPETTVPAETVPETTEETAAPTEAETEPVTEIPEPEEPDAPEPTEPACTGLADCSAASHGEDCEKQLADEKAAEDEAAAAAVLAQMQALPTLEALQNKPMAQQREDYERVQAVYDAYCGLSSQQQALLPSAEEFFKPYFDYFNSLVSMIWSGSGTSSSPFLIYTEAELRSLAQQVSSGNTYRGSCFRLVNDIALTDTWTPIGTETYHFCGTFDGNGKTISGMTATGDYIGLFGYVGSGAVIKNLNLTEVSMRGIYYVGGIAACVDAGSGSVTVTDCHVSGSLYGEGRDEDGDSYGGYVGGIAAYVIAENGSVTMENCSMSGESCGDTYVGGLIGYGKSSGRNLTLTNCVNHASIPVGSNSDNSGGIAGYLVSAQLESCMNYGAVSGNAYSEENGSSWLGGISGSGTDILFKGCGNYGSISTFFAGGITPSQYGQNVVESCLNVGKLTHSSDGYGTALIRSGTASNSFYLSGTGTGITGATAATAAQMASGEVAHALRDYFGQTLGVDSYPKPLTDSNRVYKVSVLGEANGSFYVNYGQTAALPELSGCAAYFDGDSKFDVTTPITRDYALAAKAYHNYADGVCIYCGNEGVDYVDVGTCGTSVIWSLGADGILKISGTGPMTDYTSAASTPWNAYASQIQSLEIGAGVTEIGDYAFAGLTNVTSVSLPDTVTAIGKFAFSGQSQLTAVTVGDAVTEIGESAFDSCYKLTSVTLGRNLKTIGRCAFYRNESLTSIVIPASVTSLGHSAFLACSALEYVTLKEGLQTIGAYALSEIKITDLQIPASVTKLEDYALANNRALVSVTFLGSAPQISAYAFWGDETRCLVPEYDSSWASKVNYNYGGTLTWAMGCGNFSDALSWNLDFEGTLTVSGTGAMYDFSYPSYGYGGAPWYSLRKKIQGVVISDGVTTIGDYAFFDCSNLQWVSMADSVTKIGRVSTYSSYGYCFRDCTSLQQIVIPKNVTQIAYSAFYGCSSLLTIDVVSGNTAYSSVNGVLYNSSGNTLYAYPAGKTGTVTIPSAVRILAPYAFVKCNNLTEITIPSGVTAIEEYAFGYCKQLSKITFAGSAPTIAGDAFYNVTATVDYPFSDTTWTASVMKDYCGTLTWKGATGTCGSGVQWELTYQKSSAVLTISGTGAMSDYTADTVPWKDHMDSIKTLEVGAGVTSVGAYALYDADSLTTVKLADSVTAVGNYAFASCDTLTSLSLGSGLQSIGDYAFMYLKATSLELPDSLKTIGESAFHTCSLKSVAFGSKLQSIGYLAFGSSASLETVDLGTGVTTLDQYAFNNCTKLKKIVIPASVTSIGAYAFRWCYDLRYVEFQGNAPTIGSYAFTDVTCNAYYPASNSSWTSAMRANYGGTLTWGTVSQRGTCGSNAEWILDAAGNLLICGSGTMSSYSASSNAPWYPYRTSIKKVTIKGVTSIGAYAFFGCTGLNTITVPATVTSLGNYAFGDCTGLKVVMFEGSAPSFGANAFSGVACEAWYPSTSSWSSSVRKDYGGTLTWRSTSSRGTCGTTAWWALDSTGALVVVGSGPMTTYYSASSQPWYSINTSIKSVGIGEGITTVGKYAFSGCTAIQTVTLGSTVTTVDGYAFNGCTALREAVIGDSVTTVGDRAFSYSTALTSVTVGKNVTSIGSMAFAGCTALTSVTFLGNAPGITYNAFNSVTATAYYPMTNTTWTTSKQSAYGGTLTWVAVCTSHKETVLAAVEPTCTETGLTEGTYCSLCSEVLVAQEEIPARGHFALGPDNTQVPADTLEPDCVADIVCTVCKAVVTEAAGHRVLGLGFAPRDPLTITNTSAYPFTLTGGTYYSTNTGNSTTSNLVITAQYGCSLTLNYGVSSESNYDKLIILQNNVTKSTISGESANRTLTLSLAAGDVVTVRYQKDSSQSSGQDRGWVSLVYDWVTVETTVDLPADSAEPDCIDGVICHYCGTQVKEAPGHRVILRQPVPENPFGIRNNSTVPFALTEGVYYSTNHDPGSSSEIWIEANTDCTVTLTYGVSSETYDKLYILLNNVAQDTISGVVSDKTLTLNLTAGDTVIVRYKKDSSINQNEDRGWVSVRNDTAPATEIVPADTVEADCDGVTCDFCQTVVKEPLGHTEVVDEAVAATCTEDGLTEGRHCSACGVVLAAQEVIPAGHTVENGICTRCRVYGTCGTDLTWTLDEAGTLTISGTGEMDGYQAMETAPWFLHREAIQKVTIPDGVTMIGSYAFYSFRNMTAVEIPDSVTSIDSYAFADCSSLTQVEIPGSVALFGASGVFSGCSSLSNVTIPAGITAIGQYTFRNCSSLAAMSIPDSVTSIGYEAFLGCSALTEIQFEGSAPTTINAAAFTGVSATAYYPAGNAAWTANVMQNYGGSITWVPYGQVENRVNLDIAGLEGQTSLWIDGVEYPVRTFQGSSFVDLPDGNAKTMVAYTYHVGDSSDVHTRYPIGMQVWTLNCENGTYTVTRAEDLDDMLGYEGCSIRITGSQGIRMITSIDQADKAALTSEGLAGYTLKEYGTAVAWASQLEGGKPLTLGQSYVRHNYAYHQANGKDPVFDIQNGRIQYTNVLVGFDLNRCGEDLAMRPYMILADAQGNEIILYGGIMERSIRYIASEIQQLNLYPAGSAEYEYLQTILEASSAAN